MSGYASGATSGAPGQPPVSAADQPRELLSLSHAMTTQGEILLVLSGELDVSSAEQAFGWVGDAIDRHKAPVVVDMASLNFCDARGLGMFVRMSKYAKQAGCSLRLTSPQAKVLKIMRITRLDTELMMRPRDPAGH